MAQQTHLIVNQAVAGNSAIVHCSRRKDEAGLFVVQLTGGGSNTCTVRLMGRADSNAPMYVVDEITDVELVAGVGAAIVALFPQMRIDVIAVGGTTPSLNCWLVE